MSLLQPCPATEQQVLPQVATSGARLVAISPQSPDKSLSTMNKAGVVT